MKTVLLILFASLAQLLGQTPESLEVPVDSPLYRQLLIALRGRELAPGKEISLKIVPAPKRVPTKPTQPESSTFLADSANFSKFRGTKLPENIVRTATRSGGLANVQIVALSPSDKATTVRPQPRLWWHQSDATQSRELEFVLSQIDSEGIGTTLFRRDIPAMKKGYNVIDLSNPAINPENHQLKPGLLYQWTINHRDGETSSPVFARLTLVENEKLRTAVLTKPANPETLTLLNAEGNWYELLDTYCTLASRMKEDKSFAQFRDKLLSSAQLSKLLTSE